MSGVNLDIDLFIKQAAYLSNTNCRLIFSYVQQAEEDFIRFTLTCVSFPPACECLIGAGLVLTGKLMRGSREMRTATILAWRQINWCPVNLFRGFCPCICLTLKLLPSISGFPYVTVCSFLPPPQRAKARRESRRTTRVC